MSEQKWIHYYNKAKDQTFNYLCCKQVYEAAKAMEKEKKIVIIKSDWEH